MKARLNWSNHTDERPGLRALEWIFLLVGLLAVDCYVWVNTSSVLYQAYEDWAFDQTLRGLAPSVGGFIKDETHWLVGGREKAETAETPKPISPTTQPNVIAPPGPNSVIGRLEIPRLQIGVMVREGADEGPCAEPWDTFQARRSQALLATLGWPVIATRSSGLCATFAPTTQLSYRLRPGRTAIL